MRASLILALGLLLGAAPAAADATTFDIDTPFDTSGDPGVCSLRAAVENANAEASVHAGCPPGGASNRIVFDALADRTVQLAAPIVVTAGDLTLERGVVDGAGATRLFVVEGKANLQLDGMTLMRGNAGDQPGGGVLLRAPAAVIATNDTRFVANNAGTGGAIAADAGSTLTLDHARFLDNVANTGGGALDTDTTTTITLALFESNFVANGDGGAILARAASVLAIADSYFYDQWAFGHGGAIATNGVLEVMRSSFHSNRATDDGGAIAIGALAAARDFVVANATFDGNYAYSADEHEPRRGAAIHVAPAIASDARIVNDTFVDNVGVDQVHLAAGTTASVRFANNLVHASIGAAGGCGGAALATSDVTEYPHTSCGKVDVADLKLATTRNGGWFGQAFRVPDGVALPLGNAATCASDDVANVDQLGHARAQCVRGAIEATAIDFAAPVLTPPACSIPWTASTRARHSAWVCPSVDTSLRSHR